MSIPASRLNNAYADTSAIKAISPNERQDGDAARDVSTGYGWHFDADSSASASSEVLVPDAGDGRWLADSSIRADAAPAMQTAAATLASGTATISTGVVISAASEVVPILTGAITGSTNFASLRELKSSRVNGAAGTGSITVEAVGSDGAKDADAAGAIRVLIFTPQT